MPNDSVHNVDINQKTERTGGETESVITPFHRSERSDRRGYENDYTLEERNIGRILVEAGKLKLDDVKRVLELQEEEGLFFGDAAQKLKLVKPKDVQYALARQFGYPAVYPTEGIFSKELVAAYDPFGSQTETFRAIRAHLMANWLSSENRVMCVVSPGDEEGRSYVAANLAVTFSQLGKSTLLIDGDFRKPRQHQIFGFSRRVGLSAMLSGRIKKQDLDLLPEVVPFFSRLSVLGAGAVPPNPVELLGGLRFRTILDELKQFFDVIIIDSPAANTYRADVQTLAVCAEHALMVIRRDHTRMAHAKALSSLLTNAGVNVLGSILNKF